MKEFSDRDLLKRPMCNMDWFKGKFSMLLEKEMNSQEKIENAFKAIMRAGNFIATVFEKDEMHLSGEDCMKIFNMYGMGVQEIVFLAYSHRFTLDKAEFLRLLNEQKESSKNMRQC